MNMGDKDDQIEVFEGFSVPNHTPTPDEFFDVALARITNLAEIKVIAYTIRRTFGFKKRQDRISISQYVDGIRTREGRILDNGTGLARSSVVLGLDNAVKHGYLEKHLYCRSCSSEVLKSETIERRFKNQKTEGFSKISAVPKNCPVCQAALEGQINVYYSLKIKQPSDTVRDQSGIRTGGGPAFGLGPVRYSDSQETVLQDTVNNVNVDFSFNGKNGHPTASDEILLADIAAELGDKNPKSKAAFTKVINVLGSEAARQLLSLTKEAHRRGQIRGKKAPYFIGMAKNIAGERGLNLGFGSPLTKRAPMPQDTTGNKEAIKNLPPDLQAAFGRIMEKVGSIEAVRKDKGRPPEPAEV